MIAKDDVLRIEDDRVVGCESFLEHRRSTMCDILQAEPKPIGVHVLLLLRILEFLLREGKDLLILTLSLVLVVGSARRFYALLL